MGEPSTYYVPWDIAKKLALHQTRRLYSIQPCRDGGLGGSSVRLAVGAPSGRCPVPWPRRYSSTLWAVHACNWGTQARPSGASTQAAEHTTGKDQMPGLMGKLRHCGPSISAGTPVAWRSTTSRPAHTNGLWKALGGGGGGAQVCLWWWHSGGTQRASAQCSPPPAPPAGHPPCSLQGPSERTLIPGALPD
jgi:hypothetical protein